MLGAGLFAKEAGVKGLVWVLALVLATTMVLSGCSPAAVVQPKVVCATIKPIAMIVQAIAGDVLEVRVLADDNAVPLQNARELASASAVVFQSGMPIDAWSSKIVPTNVQQVTLPAATAKTSSGSPWLSLQQAVDMAGRVRGALDTAYPVAKDKFDVQYAGFLNECSQADGVLKKMIWGAHTRAFLAEDATWSAAAADFGLRVMIEPGLKGLDLSGAEAGTLVAKWGSGEKTMVVVVNAVGSESTGVEREANGIVVCRLDSTGTMAQGDFVAWLRHQLETLGSALSG